MAADTLVTNVPESEATRLLREQKEREAAMVAQHTPRAGQVVMSESEYNAAMTKAKEDARKEEKEKLYNRIRRSESLEKANNQLQAQVNEMEKKLSDLATKVSPPAPQTPISVEQIPNELLKLVVETATADLRKQVSDLSTLLVTEQANKHASAIKLLRETLIREAGGKIIEALVTGDTEEVLRANAEMARGEYDRIASQYAPVTPAPTVVSAPQSIATAAPTPPPSTPPVSVGLMTTPQITPLSAAPAGNTQESEFTNSVGQMSTADYAKNRTAILKRMKELYPTGQRNPML